METLCLAAIPLNVSPAFTVYVAPELEVVAVDVDEELELDFDELEVFVSNFLFGKFTSDDKLLTEFRFVSVVLYFWAIDQSVSPFFTVCVAASASSAAKMADAIAALAVTDITIFLFAKFHYSSQSMFFLCMLGLLSQNLVFLTR